MESKVCGIDLKLQWRHEASWSRENDRTGVPRQPMPSQTPPYSHLLIFYTFGKIYHHFLFTSFPVFCRLWLEGGTVVWNLVTVSSTRPWGIGLRGPRVLWHSATPAHKLAISCVPHVASFNTWCLQPKLRLCTLIHVSGIRQSAQYHQGTWSYIDRGGSLCRYRDNHNSIYTNKVFTEVWASLNFFSVI